MTDKIRLEKKTYLTVKSMLESPDDENQYMGFQCIENSDFKSNMVYILLLLREVNLGPETWKTNAPETIGKIEAITNIPLARSVISFDTIGKMMLAYKVDQEDFQFFMDRYAEHLKNSFGLEHVAITVKI